MGNTTNYERKSNTSASASSSATKSMPCAGCMKAVKWIPVLFIWAVIVWSYYAYVVQLCIFTVENTFEKIIFIIVFHIIFLLFMWAYWNTIFTDIGTVPAHWRIPESDIERIFRADNQEQQKRILEKCAKSLPITNRTLNGSVRFCEKCKIIKPDRAHHCSVCGTCVLKMDHHCPWVNNCVNFTNYKFFVLFLGYALIYCLYVALTSLEYIIAFWRSEFNSQGELNGGARSFHILFLFFVALMFAISLVSLFGYHIYLVLMNRTTLEAFRAPVFRVGGPDKNGFNLGSYANFQEVFGDNWKLWFLPVFSSMGDGTQYPTQVQHQHPAYQSMGDTQTATVAAGSRLEAGRATDKLINSHMLENTTTSTSLNNHHPYDHEFESRQHEAAGGDAIVLNMSYAPAAVNSTTKMPGNSPSAITPLPPSSEYDDPDSGNVVINMQEIDDKVNLRPPGRNDAHT